MAVQTIGVIGAGTMGNGIAQTFAVAGYPVRMQDIQEAALERGVASIDGSLQRLAKRGRLSADDAAAALERITPGCRAPKRASPGSAGSA